MISPSSIIEKKRDGYSLTKEEMALLIQGPVDEAQWGALLMACYLKGLSAQETHWLTESMLHSGEVLSFPGPTYVDKHSTGGVGDKTTLIVAPLAAACGARVPMISGRGLGHTGGTIDKLESLPGFQTSLPLETFRTQVQDIGLAIISQSERIAPADGKIYALRDVTATINSLPLIVASIMSKKLAEGANGFVFDVKVGLGAFMPELPQARALAQALRETARSFGKRAITFITDMNAPLGLAVGHTLEALECFEVLQGGGPEDLRTLSLELAAGMVFLAGQAPDFSQAQQKVRRALDSGKAWEKFTQLAQAQGGSLAHLQNPQHLQVATETTPLLAPRQGFVATMGPKLLGELLIELGGGRKQKGASIDHAVGARCLCKIGDKVSPSQPLMELIHHKSQAQQVQHWLGHLAPRLVGLSEAPPGPLPLIKEGPTL